MTPQRAVTGQLLTYTDDQRMATMQQKLPFPEKRRPGGRHSDAIEIIIIKVLPEENCKLYFHRQ